MMRVKFLIAFLSCFIFNFCWSQVDDNQGLAINDTLYRIEKHILYREVDSAMYFISTLEKTPYLNKLSRIAEGEVINYSDYIEYFENLKSRIDIPYQSISSFIENSVVIPQNETTLDLDYVKLKTSQIASLRNDVSIEEASKVQTNLENYIAKFNPKDIEVRRAQILASSHQVVLYIIQKEIEKGKKLCLDNFEEAEVLSDKESMIMSLYYLTDFLIYERKLDEYISTCEKALQIESTLELKSPYYEGLLINSIDAYIFKGGEDQKVQELLQELYDCEECRPESYVLYTKYLGTKDLESPDAQAIFNQFNVSGLLEFCAYVNDMGAKILNSNDLSQLQIATAKTLSKHEFYREAMDYNEEALELTRNIYSKDLANSLANYKSYQALKEKDLIIEYKDERNNLYIIIATLIGGLLFIMILAYTKKQKQSQILEDKNKQIKNALKEKELLVKEVHHRVKNNFQIISSLLELQTKGIKDKKALNLAEDGKNRIKSIALVHEKLYQNEGGLIDFKAYLQLLVKELSAIYNRDSNVKTNLNLEDIHFDVDRAVPLGLIINELMTNSYKYAFNDQNEGILNITIHKSNEKEYTLIVSDNGTGLKPEINFENIESVGLKLVTSLVKQIRGTLSYKTNNGAHFEICFKDV
jgi:two-component sensor histidine kinase